MMQLWRFIQSISLLRKVKEMEEVALTSKKGEADMSKSGTKVETMFWVEKAWMCCKEAATDRTFIFPFVIICTLFTFQALSG